jgi:hypothetical protein
MVQTYVSDPMSQTPIHLRPMFQTLWLETYGYAPNTYSSQTPMAGDLCLKHLWLEPYVSDTYGWGPMPRTPSLELGCFSDTINLSGDLWCQTLFM